MVNRVVAFVAGCVLATSSVSADIMFSLVPVGSTTVQQGTAVTIQLVASDPDGIEIGNGDTWFGFNAVVQADSPDANDAPAQVLGPKFVAPAFPPAGLTAAFDVDEGRVFASGINVAPLANGDVLASFTYTADVLGDTTFNFNTTSALNNGAALTSGNFDINNALNAVGTTTITVTATAVPEPSSVALLGLVGVGLCVARFRRRKTA